MPTTDFTTKLLELEDVNIHDVQSSNTEIHLHFTMIRKTHTCPKCGNLTDKCKCQYKNVHKVENKNVQLST